MSAHPPEATNYHPEIYSLRLNCQLVLMFLSNEYT